MSNIENEVKHWFKEVDHENSIAERYENVSVR